MFQTEEKPAHLHLAIHGRELPASRSFLSRGTGGGWQRQWSRLVCARTTTRTTLQLSSLVRTGTTSKWFATNPRPTPSPLMSNVRRQRMRKFATPEILFAAFVVVSVIAGLSLAALEGERDRHAGLEALLLLSFFSVVPLRIAAAIAERREVQASEGVHRSSQGSAFLTPLRLFLFGIASEGISRLGQQLASTNHGSLLAILLDVLSAAAMPSILASLIWVLVRWTSRGEVEVANAPFIQRSQ